MTFGESTWWDATVPLKHLNINIFKEWLLKACDRAVVGKETGQGGYEHWQVRMAFKEPWTLQAVSMVLPTAHLSPTSVRNFEYIYKGGDYWTTWDQVLERYRHITLRPWQQEAYCRYITQNERQILLVIDRIGNSGKSWLARYIVSRHEGRLIPPMENGKGLVQNAMAEGSTGYIIDVPRRGKLTYEFWGGIEQIKGGHLYETRYNYSEKWIEPPKIMVFTNKEPNLNDLSVDRWDLLRLT